MRQSLPDFYDRSLEHQRQLGEQGANQLLEAGWKWHLSPVLQTGGAVVFPHATLSVCGHQIAAAVHACLDSGASRVLVLGVLHALTEELEEARVRVGQGGEPAREPSWGIQGPGLAGREDWRREFSLLHFLFLFTQEVKRRGIAAPELLVRYPYLAGGHPERLPGISELDEWVRGGAVLVATTDPLHHGIGYGESPETALAPNEGGLELAQRHIKEGLQLLSVGDYLGYQQQCIATKSDGGDVGQVLRHLLRQPLEVTILDIVADDMSEPYQKPPPTWVAGALITLAPQRVMPKE